MIVLSGAKEQFDQVVVTMLDAQREALGEIIDDRFFEEFKESMLREGYESLMPKIIPIYKTYLTEPEVEGLIAFYSSEVGKSFVKKTPIILQELTVIGGEWGQEIALSIMDKLNESDIIKFERVIAEDCSVFRTGTFESNDNGREVTIIREDGYQTEFYKNNSFKFKIEWESNNRYLLKVMDANGKEIPTATLEVNIIEVTGNSYKYMSRGIGTERYQEGTIHKVE